MVDLRQPRTISRTLEVSWTLETYWIFTVQVGWSDCGEQRGELIATFIGVRRTAKDYSHRCQQGYGGYAIALRNGDVLDFFTAAKSGACLASMANHSGENGFGARYIMRHDGLHVARSNAHIKVTGSMVRLFAGRFHESFGDSGSEDEDTIVIRGGDEVLWNYRVTEF